MDNDLKIFNIPALYLCNKHLIAQHGNIHLIYNALVYKRKYFINYPEVIKYNDKLMALYDKHQCIVREMEDRGYCHNSPLDRDKCVDTMNIAKYMVKVNNFPEQIEYLNSLGCGVLMS